jgi:hypothetical protein
MNDGISYDDLIAMLVKSEVERPRLWFILKYKHKVIFRSEDYRKTEWLVDRLIERRKVGKRNTEHYKWYVLNVPGFEWKLTPPIERDPLQRDTGLHWGYGFGYGYFSGLSAFDIVIPD